MKQEKKSVAIQFVNWTDQDFTHKWDNVDYTFKAGESQLIQDYLAHHFAKHLAQREINRKKLLMTDPKFKIFYDKCLTGENIEAETDLKLEIKMKEKPKVDSKKEAMKKRMAKARAAKKIKAEEEFAGLKE